MFQPSAPPSAAANAAGPDTPVLRQTSYGGLFFDPPSGRYIKLGHEDAKRVADSAVLAPHLADVAVALQRSEGRLRVLPSVSAPAPLKLFVNLTKRCNLYCTHCFNGSGEPDASELPFAALLSTIDACEALGVLKLTLAGGEPLIYSRFGALCRRLADTPFHVSIVTNGIPLTARRVREIVGCPVLRSVTISLDGASEATNAILRGVGSYAGALEGLRRLKSDYEGELALRMTVHAGNRHEADQFVDLAVREGVRHVKINRLNPYGRAAGLRHKMLRDEDFDAFSAELAMRAEAKGVALEVPANKYLVEASGLLGLCRAGSETLELDADGRVYPCSFSAGRFCLGSVVEASLEAVLEQAQDFSINNSFCMACRGRGGQMTRPVGYVPGLVSAAS